MCGKPDWCSISIDGKKAICRREGNGTGVRKVDKSGQEYYLFELNGHGGSGLPLNDLPENHEVPEKVDPETLDRMYVALLDELSLSQPHRRDLHRRGLSEAFIKRAG